VLLFFILEILNELWVEFLFFFQYIPDGNKNKNHQLQTAVKNTADRR
jgi:hypothetical protein